MMPIMSTSRGDAMQEWEGKARQIAQYAEEIIKLQTTLDLLFATNGLMDRIGTTAEGETVAGSTYTREQALAVVEMLAAFKTWTATPLPQSARPPLGIIFYR